MKRQILIGVVLALCCFILGGAYILQSVSSLTSQLENLAAFHQVETLRKSLENRIRAVQSDLLLQNLKQPVQFNTFVNDAEAVQHSVLNCQTCHHNASTSRYLEQLVGQTELYLKTISRTLTLRSNQTRIEQTLQEAYQQGESLLNLSDEVLSLTTQGSTERTRLIQNSVNKTQRNIFALVILGPLLIISLAWLFINRYRGSIAALIDGTEELEKGNLDYRIPAELKDEFQVLSKRINTMAANLNKEKHYTESVQRLYRGLFDSARDAICIIATGPEDFGKILTVNAAATELYGYSMNEMLTMNCAQLSSDTDASEFLEIINQIIAGVWTRGTVTRQRKNGSLFPAEVSAGTMQLDGHTYVLSFARDISEREQAKKELLHANQMSIAGQMAVGLAHEIKNPLAGIKATVEVLSAELELSPDDKELFARIVKEVDRMERLLKDLLKFARPPQPQLEMTNLNRVLEYTMKNVELSVSRSAPGQVLFLHEFDPRQPLIEIDAAQLQQVFLNIYLNAVDALAGPGQIITRTRLLVEEEKVLINIEDDGPGIPEATLEKIFTPFFTTKSRGSGLGLSICRRLIDQHKGTINAVNNPDKGTNFIITLPIKQPQNGA